MDSMPDHNYLLPASQKAFILKADFASMRYPRGQLIDRMPIEIFGRVVANMSIADLAAFGGTCRENFSLMHEIIMTRIEEILENFGVPVVSFMEMMGSHQAIISGSMALYIFSPCPTWYPNDMDIYVPRYRARKVIRRLRGMGFIPVSGTIPTKQYCPRNAIASVTKLTNGDVSIDVIESWTRSPFDPIFKFHLTAVMNYMSVDGFFSAYPRLTTRYRSLKSALAFDGTAPNRKTERCYEKYKERGFSLMCNPITWDEEDNQNHRCRVAWSCPHRLRSTYDEGCLFVPFRTNPVPLDGQGTVYTRCFDERKAIVWHLGGEPCRPEYEPLSPFSTTIGGYSQF